MEPEDLPQCLETVGSGTELEPSKWDRLQLIKAMRVFGPTAAVKFLFFKRNLKSLSLSLKQQQMKSNFKTNPVRNKYTLYCYHMGQKGCFEEMFLVWTCEP